MFYIITQRPNKLNAMKTKLLMVALLLCIATSYAQKTHVPDDNFEQALIDLGVDDVLDDYVTTANINTITSLDVSNKAISDLKGIEDFISLKKLYCSNNKLTQLDFSKHKKLYVLDCSSNKLVSLNVKNGILSRSFSFDAQNNPDLTCITADPYASKYWKKIDTQTSFSTDCKGIYTGLTYVPSDGFEQHLIDLGVDDVLDNYVLTSKIEKITEFKCGGTDCTGLEDFINLRSLSISVGPQSNETIDLSKMVHLEKLKASTRKANMVDLSKNLALKELRITTNEGGAYVNLEKHLALEIIDISYNAFGSVRYMDLSNHTKLKEVRINKVIGLNLGNCTALESVYAGNCNEGINLTNCIALKSLDFRRSSSLKSLDVSTCTALESIKIEENWDIKSLDFSKNTNLENVYLRELYELESLTLKNGNNKNLDLTLRVVPKLTCTTVDDATYLPSNWHVTTYTGSGGTFSTDCSSVLATDNFELKEFVIYPNPVKSRLKVNIEEEANYRLVNMNGQTIFTGKLTFRENSIDVSRLANGVYYLNLKTDRAIVSKKIMKY